MSLAMIIPALAGAAMLGAKVFGRDKQADAADAAKQQKDSDFIHKMAQDRANEGDADWFAQNQQHLDTHMSPAVLQSLLSHAENQNQRLYEKDPSTVRLSPFNQQRRAMTSGDSGQMANLIGGLNQQMSTIPMEQRGGSYYQQLLNQRGQMIDAESQATPGPLAGETQQLGQLNQQLGQALNPTAPAPASAAQPSLTVPASRKASSRVLQTSIGPVTQQVAGTTGKEVLSSLISQADQQNLHPNEVVKRFHQENTRRLQTGEPALDFDEASVKSYREQHWENTRATIQQNLQSQGMDPQQAFVQSAQLTAQQLPNVPDRWMQFVKPDPQHQAGEAYRTAVGHANDLLQSRLQAMQSPAAKGVKPNYLVEEPFLLQAANSIPGLTPESHTRLLHEMASTSHAAFLSAVQQTHPELDPQQQNYHAMMLASKATGGNVPPQWRAFVEQDMKQLFGLSDAQMTAYAALSPFQRPDPLSPDFRHRLHAAQTQLEMSADVRKAMLSTVHTPEGVAAAQSALQTGDTFGKLDQSGMQQATKIGQMERNIQAQQEGRLGQQKQDIERKNAIIPTAHLEKLQGADTLYKAGVEAQKFAAHKDKSGQTIVDKYGGMPGTFFDFINRAKNEFGKQDPVLQSYLNRLGMVYNLERHELTGAATSVYEGKTLTPFLPSPNDNIRTGLRKLNGLVKTMAEQLDRNLDQAKSDYPRSDHDAFFRNQVRKQRSKSAKEK